MSDLVGNKPQEQNAPHQTLADVSTPLNVRWLYHLAQQRLLSAEALEESLRISQVIPNRKSWQDFISKTLLLLGTTLLLCGIIFFFAYNWANLHKFVKLGISQAIILAFIIGVGIKGLDHIAGKCSLLGACVMIGAALGVYGTIYQTGADPYELFLGWSLLMTGWVVISNFGGLWFTWLILINVGFILYANQTYGYKFDIMGNFYLSLFFVNLTAVAAWEHFYLKKIKWLQNRFFPRAINLFVHCALLPPIFIIIFGDGKGSLLLIPIFYVLYLTGVFVFYQKQIRDLFALTLNCLSLIIVLSCVFGKVVVNNTETTILMSLFIMGITATAGYWLNKVGKSWDN